jgi:hypothetical protein
MDLRMLKIDVCLCFGRGERVELGKKRRPRMNSLGVGNSGWAPRDQTG